MKKEILIEAYTLMQKIRQFDMTLHEMVEADNKDLMGIMHSHIGAEAYSVAISLQLNKDDYIATTYRNHAHSIAKGMDLKGLAAELYGKETGVCKANGGNMHAVDQDLNIVAGFGIIGAGIPSMLGTGFASKYKGTNEVSVAYFGDGAIPQGAFHESMNLAMKWELPVLFANDNNGYAMSTPTRSNLVHDDTIGYAKGYDMPCLSCNGLDFFDSYKTTEIALEHIRSGKGPFYVEYKTYRYHGQWEGDPQNYKPQEEVEKMWQFEPIKIFEKNVIGNGFMTEQELADIRKQVRREVDEAYEFAKKSKMPDSSHIYKYVYADKY